MKSRVLLLFAAAALVLASGISPHWRIGADSGRYLEMSVALHQGHGYNLDGRPEWSIPPAVPLYYAAVFKAVGFTPSLDGFTRAFAPVNAFSVLMGFAGLVFAYLLVREVAGNRWALFVTALVASSRFYYSGSVTPLTDVPYACFSWAALFFLARTHKYGRNRDRTAAASLLTLSALTRVVAVALVLAAGVWFLLAIIRDRSCRRRNALNCLVLAPAAAAGAFMLLAAATADTAYFSYHSQLLAGHGFAALAGRFASNAAGSGPYAFEFVTGQASAAGVWVPLVLLAAIGAVRSWKNGRQLLVLYFLANVAFVTLTVKMIPRLYVPLAPLLYVFLFDGVAATLGRFRRPALRLHLPRILLALVVAANLVYIAKTIKENFADDFYSVYDHGRWADYIDLSGELRQARTQRRVLCYWWTVLRVLSGGEVVPVPDTIPEGFTNDRLLADYIRRNDVSRVVIDPDSSKAGIDLAGFIERHGDEFPETARFGRLRVYSRAGVQASPPPSPPGKDSET